MKFFDIDQTRESYRKLLNLNFFATCLLYTCVKCLQKPLDTQNFKTFKFGGEWDHLVAEVFFKVLPRIKI